MRSTAIDRRSLLGLMAGGAAGLMIPHAFAKVPEQVLYLGCKADYSRQNAVAGFGISGRKVFELDLPRRGHGLALTPDNRICAVLARRPGGYVQVLSLPDGKEMWQAESPPGRHQQGHGVWSHDGKRLYTTENNFDAGHGVIGIYENGKHVGEFSSHGIEPHEILLAQDGRTLIVANGGIRTHPDQGRARLNLDEMESNLALIDAQTGALKAKAILPRDMHLVSMRHLVQASNGAIFAVNQYQGAETDHVPLLVRWHQGQLTPLYAPKDIQGQWRNYVGGITLDQSQTVMAASLPRSNRVAYFGVQDGAYLGQQEIRDGCGVAAGATQHTFVTGSGFGGARVMGPGGILNEFDDRWLKSQRWDNHLMIALL